MAVRRNFLESLKSSIRESFVTNMGMIGLSIVKIAVIILVFIFEQIPTPTYVNSDGELQLIEKQIQGFCLMIIYDGFNIFQLLYLLFVINKYKSATKRTELTERLIASQGQQDHQNYNNIHNQQQVSIQHEQNLYNSQVDYSGSSIIEFPYQNLMTMNNINFIEIASHRDKLLRYSSLIKKIIYFVLFLFGNYFAYINQSCSTVFPLHYYTLVWLVALGYFSFGFQILLFLSICLCFPLTLFLFVLMRNRTNSSISAKNEIINKLIPTLYKEKINNSEFESQKECCICLVDYQLDDQIISLPCSKMHHYHYDCVVKWLNVSGVCPICKQPLDQYFKDLEDIKQNNGFY